MVQGKKQNIYTPKMQAKNYRADIIGINLEYALEAYDWRDLYPITKNGVTVTAVWDKRQDAQMPNGYVMDESGRFLVLDAEAQKPSTDRSPHTTTRVRRS